MLNLEDLQQFVAFYNYGTLTKVAEELHISQPTITRTMKRVEESFGVSLFTRTSNKIELNETGRAAAESAIRLLESSKQCESEVRAFDQKLHTITVESCAPAPLWTFVPMLTRKHAEKTISYHLADDREQIKQNLLMHECSVAILTEPVEAPGIRSYPYVEEHLSICVPPSHALADHQELTASEINGYNCLLSSDIGFWAHIHKSIFPASKFFVQTDEEAFAELIRESNLPNFTTDLAMEYFQGNAGDRIVIPITDPEVNVTFYVCYHEADGLKLE